IIKSRGEKVAPKEVENVIYAIEAVAEAAVIGVDDPVLGQSIKAFVALKEGCSVNAQEILRHCARNLEAFMVPQSVEFMDVLPKGATGKIDKKVLQAR